MGDSRPDNTSAIIALQRAASTPMEMTKQQDYQAMEDACRIWIDMMAVYYGTRMVEKSLEMDPQGQQPLGMELPAQKGTVPFDFGVLGTVLLAVKIDVGASSYWSEIATVQTCENLLMNNHIDVIQFLERIPEGYIAKKQELINELKSKLATPQLPATGTGMSTETTGNLSAQLQPQGGPGNGALQRALNREGA